MEWDDSLWAKRHPNPTDLKVSRSIAAKFQARDTIASPVGRLHESNLALVQKNDRS
jgi:hypothetical protein